MALILKRTSAHYPDSSWSEDHFVVLSGQFVVGIIRKMYGGAQGDRWSWAINGVHADPDVMEKHGMADTREAAMQDFRANWAKWLSWAGLKEE